MTFLPDSVVTVLPRGDHSLTDLDRALKRIDVWRRIMLQMFPYGNVDVSIKLLPVGTNVSKRAWERELCEIRRSL